MTVSGHVNGVLQHLEGVSGRLLAHRPEAIVALVGDNRGVYVLHRRGKLYEAGPLGKLPRRLERHLKEQRSGKWDRFSLYVTGSDEAGDRLEALLLRVVAPNGARHDRGLAASEDLSTHLNGLCDEVSDRVPSPSKAPRRAPLTGTRYEPRALRKRFDNRRVLHGENNGVSYSAVLNVDGSITRDGRKYDSPSGAGKAALGRDVNGWKFWHYRDVTGAWVPLDEARKARKARKAR